MRTLAIITILILTGTTVSIAQDKDKSDGFKPLRFNNITEATVGFQIGKTTRTTSFAGGESEANVAGHKFPAPRLATSFGLLVGELFYFGPGIAYTFQPADKNNSLEHQVSVFGQTRLNFAKGRIRPFLDFKGGYHFASLAEANQTLDSDWYKWDGFFLEPALGLSFKLGKHALLNTSLGYQFVNAGNRIEQSIMTDSGNPIIDATLKENYHRLLLTIGFTFQ